MKAMLLISAVALAAGVASAAAEDVTVGLIVPMTGPFASTGKQEKAAVELYMAQHGDKVAGKTIKLIVKDDTAAPDITKRLAQELVSNDHAVALWALASRRPPSPPRPSRRKPKCRRS